MRRGIMGLCCLVTVLAAGCSKDKQEEAVYSGYGEAGHLSAAYEDAGIKIRDVLWTHNVTPDGRGQIMEQTAEAIIAPLEQETVAFLRNRYQLNVYEFMPPGHPEIATLGQIALEAHRLEQLGYTIDTTYFDNWGKSGSVNTQSRGGDVLECLEQAFGIPIGLILGNAEGTTRRALIRAARRLASRTLGYAALAYAMYDFGDCMDWW